MAKKGVILGQDKNYTGKLPTKELEKAINKLKVRYQDHSDDSKIVLGFEINGGDDLTKPGHKKMDEFKTWAKKNGLDAEYNSNSDLQKITLELRNRVDNQNTN